MIRGRWTGVLILILIFCVWVSACTTVGAVGKAAAAGVTILAKNRDYPVDAGQILFFEADLDHPTGEQVALQYITIPQSAHTWQVLGFKALDERGRGRNLWRWGLGMGMNRHQVAVANDDAGTWDRFNEPALHDNDLTRLILERCRTAREAVDLVDALLSRYHSNEPEIYTVADPHEVWIIETTGSHWAAQRIVDDVFARANRFEIVDPDLPDDSGQFRQGRRELLEFARSSGHYREEAGRFSFRLTFSDDYLSPLNIHYNETRYRRATQLLAPLRGRLTQETIATIMRDHFEGWQFPKPDGSNCPLAAGRGDPHASLEHTLLAGHPTRTICYGGTVGSMICVADPRAPAGQGVMWALFSVPCLSAYVPLFPGVKLDLGPAARTALDAYDAASAYWQYTAVWRNLSPRWDDLAATEARVRTLVLHRETKERRELADLLKKAATLKGQGREAQADRVLADFSRRCFEQALHGELQVQKWIPALDVNAQPPSFFQQKKY